jgi:C-terminal processing protease CtpA/Prc
MRGPGRVRDHHHRRARRHGRPFDVSIIRDTIKLTAVRGRVVGNTVVLRITTFNDQTYPRLATG